MNRTTDLFDQRVADWLEEDPSEAPAQLLETVRAALPSIPQRRRRGMFGGTLFRPVLRFAPAAVTVVLAALLLLGLASGGISPPPSPTPVSTPLPLVRFDSPLYGYAISYPEGWTFRPAGERIDGINPPYVDTGVADQFNGQIGGPYPNAIIVASKSDVAAGTTLELWTSQTALAVCGTPTQPQESIEVAGQPATVSTFARCNSYFHIWVTLVRGSQAFHIVWLNFSGTEAADRQLLGRVLATFRFPEALTETFTSALYGYSITYPARFSARFATQPIQGAAPPFLGSEVVDELSFAEDVSEGLVVMASAELDVGTTLEEWTAASARGFCGEPTSTESVLVGGEPATLDTYAACEGLFHQWVTAVHNGRGYHIVWVRNPGYAASDRPLFLSMLGTFEFGPEPASTTGPS